jgi:hypothetical protein
MTYRERITFTLCATNRFVPTADGCEMISDFVYVGCSLMFLSDNVVCMSVTVDPQQQLLRRMIEFHETVYIVNSEDSCTHFITALKESIRHARVVLDAELSGEETEDEVILMDEE